MSLHNFLSPKKERDEIGRHWEAHPYYQAAESWIDSFWGGQTRFKIAFEQMDLRNVLELACGHGRHAAQIVERVKNITLSDINSSNLDVCKKRFCKLPHVQFHLTSGSDFEGVASNSKTAIFCYDAMVHFELNDVWTYVDDCARVLTPGGLALFHYSNFSANPGGHYRDNPHSRSFCSEAMFRHFTARAGLEVVSSETFGWGVGVDYIPGIDALTLIRKPLG